MALFSVGVVFCVATHHLLLKQKTNLTCLLFYYKKMSTSVSGNKCVYINCGKSRRTCKDLKLFRFPKKPEIHKQWIINCGNEDVACIPPDILRNRYVCQLHFNPEDIKPSGCLVKGAVPVKQVDDSIDPLLIENLPKIKYEVEDYFECTDAPTRIKIENPSPSTSSNHLFDNTYFISSCTNFLLDKENSDPKIDTASLKKIKKLSERLEKQKKLLKIKNAQISKLKEKLKIKNIILLLKRRLLRKCKPTRKTKIGLNKKEISQFFAFIRLHLLTKT
ncbi:hypothetical protein RI129_001715 [Pyrocoelia pectoralis]|uniref:THAP-type domain-containing protein n=1 Tax=Pyrocoelia pectoralis TaxID=417401 RepID=A0AAN7VVG9_9COLE